MSRSSLIFAALLAAPASAHASAEIGTCLTTTGTPVAPWTDNDDPACGADCGDSDDAGLCDLDGDGCLEGLEGAIQWPGQPMLPDPAAPVCLFGGPECTPVSPTTATVGSPAVLVHAEAVALPKRGTGTLPGAGPPHTVAAGAEQDLAPESPPPR